MRFRLRRLLAAVIVPLLAAGGVVAVAAPPAAAAEAAQYVDWGVKASFRSYIVGAIANGSVTLDGGVTANADGSYRWPASSSSYDPATGETVVQTEGSVHFTGHKGTLDMTISDLEVRVSPGEGSALVADVVSSKTTGETVDYGRVELASLDSTRGERSVGEGTLDWSGIPSALAEEGEAAFAGYYNRGAALDPVALHAAGDWPAETSDEAWDEPGTTVLAETAAIEAGFTPTYAVPDPTRGTVVVLGWQGSAPTSATSVAMVVDAASGERGPVVPITTTAAFAVNMSGALYTAALNERTGEVFAFVMNYGLVVIPQDASSVADVQHVTGMSSVLSYVSMGFDQAGQRLHLLDTSKGLLSFVRDEDGTWRQDATLPDQKGAAARYLTVEQATGDVWVYDATSARRALVPVSGFREGAPAVHADQAIVLYEGSGADRFGGVVSDPASGLIHALVNANGTSAGGNEIVTIRGRAIVSRTPVPDYATSISVDEAGRVSLTNLQKKLIHVYDGRSAEGALPLLATADLAGAAGAPTVAASVGGRVYVPVTAPTSSVAVYTWVTTPSFASQPQSTSATLVADEYLEDGSPTGAAPAPVTFTVEATGDPAPQIRWQTRLATGWADLADDDAHQGTSTPTLTVQATEELAGSVYRAVARSTTTDASGETVEVGALASDEATLSVEVRGKPIVTEQPKSATASSGRNAVFTVAVHGVPAPTITWQRKNGTGWTDIAARAPYTVDDGTLTVAASAALNGAVFRARLANDAGEAFSAEATLTVRAGANEPVTYTGVAFEWTGASEWQARPPFGTAHYFSAGASDGTQATYAAKRGGAEIVQRAAGGDKAATWSTRAAHVAGSGASQLVRLSNGTATVQADGSAVISWPATFSVNFYDGLMPFTVANPRLTVAKDGTGTLTADLSGYHGDMDDPFAPKKPATPAKGAVVATFTNVAVDTENGFTVTPDYAGVRISTPAGESPQTTSGSGWGSWPQQFVDFHFGTGLAGYFYSTGGTFDPRKAPAPIAVGFNGAVPQVPQQPETPTQPEKPAEPQRPGQQPTPSRGADGAVEGSLVWGVKSSFRSYITGPVAKGAISLRDGAGDQGGLFRFGQVSTDWSAGSAGSTTAYRGAVRFTGHSGILDLTFSEPTVRIDSATSGTLLVRINGGAHTALGAIDLASAARTDVDGGVSYANAPVALTEAGAAVFSYGSSRFYEAGTGMDPVSFVIGATATGSAPAPQSVAAYDATAWAPPAEPPTRTGLYIDPEQLSDLRPGSELTAVADGFEPNEKDIKVVLYSDPVVLEENLTADADGVATWTGIIPLDTEPGEHTLTFQGSVDRGIAITVQEAEELAGCTVTDGTLTWGFKESFRSYISGSIAHGEWTVSDGATYETPAFGWEAGEGAFDAETFTGQVSFHGTIRFTGHDGLLDTTVANPTILFTGPDTAYLLLDVAGLTMEDALAGDTDNVLAFEQVEFVKLDLSGGDVEVSEDGSLITATGVPTEITSQGYEAFPNYEAGTAFDPVSFTIQAEAECATAAVVEEDAEETVTAISEPAAAAPEEGADLTWLAWTGGGVALAGLIATAAIWLARRRTGSDADEGADGGGTGSDGSFDSLVGGGR